MNLTLLEIIIPLLIIAAAFFSVWYYRYRASSSERRMQAMLSNAGLDPGIIIHGNHELIIREVRSRCLKCQDEALCERWLEGKEVGENDFCPNAGVFRMLAEHAGVSC